MVNLEYVHDARDQLLAVPEFTAIRRRSSDHSQSLMLLGLKGHVRNPSNRLVELMADSATEWLMDTERHPEKRIVLNEGSKVRGPYPPDLGTYEIIKQDGEQGLMAHFARSHGIELVSAEPPDLMDFHAAALTAPREAIRRYAGMRMSRQLFESGLSMSEARETISQVLFETGEILNKNPASKFVGFDFSYPAFAADYERTYDTPFDIADYQFHLDETVNHMYSTGGSEVQIVSQLVNEHRDWHFATSLVTYFEQGRSPLYVTHIAHTERIKDQIMQLGEPRRESIVEEYGRNMAEEILLQTIRRGGTMNEVAWYKKFYSSKLGALALCYIES